MDIAKLSLQSGHIAPTAPDTLGEKSRILGNTITSIIINKKRLACVNRKHVYLDVEHFIKNWWVNSEMNE